MGKPSEIDAQISEARKKAWKQRLVIIATTVVIIVCCAVVVVKKQYYRDIEIQLQEQQRQAEYEAWMEQQRAEEARRAEENRIRELEYARRRDSIAALTKVDEQEPYKPKYTWDELETMVRNLSDEDYYASVWCVEMNTPKWVVLYSKGGKTYFRHFNPEKKTYGTKIRLIKDEIGKFHVSGNKRDRYVYGNGGTLIHEVNGVEKETFFNHRTIDLFTPEPVPDGYDDWEDYYYDNEEDFRYYYGR